MSEYFVFSLEPEITLAEELFDFTNFVETLNNCCNGDIQYNNLYQYIYDFLKTKNIVEDKEVDYIIELIEKKGEQEILDLKENLNTIINDSTNLDFIINDDLIENLKKGITQTKGVNVNLFSAMQKNIEVKVGSRRNLKKKIQRKKKVLKREKEKVLRNIRIEKLVKKKWEAVVMILLKQKKNLEDWHASEIFCVKN